MGMASMRSNTGSLGRITAAHACSRCVPRGPCGLRLERRRRRHSAKRPRRTWRQAPWPRSKSTPTSSAHGLFACEPLVSMHDASFSAVANRAATVPTAPCEGEPSGQKRLTPSSPESRKMTRCGLLFLPPVHCMDHAVQSRLETVNYRWKGLVQSTIIPHLSCAARVLPRALNRLASKSLAGSIELSRALAEYPSRHLRRLAAVPATSTTTRFAIHWRK